MTENEAEMMMRSLIKQVGGGYHPDIKLEEYQNYRTGASTFTEAEAKTLQAKADEMFASLSDPYEVGLKIFKELGYC